MLNGSLAFLAYSDESATRTRPSMALLTTVFAFVTLFSITYILGFFSKHAKYPPGPRAHPLVGHTFQVPKLKTWLYFEQLGKKYGPIVRLSLAGDDIVVLNRPEDAEQLLNKRSQNYSSRKPLVYAGKYQSQNKRLVLLSYGEELRKQRSAFHHMLQPRVVGSYENIQELESINMLLKVLQHPGETELNMKRYSASVVYTLAYGKRMDDDDKDLKDVLDILEGFIRDCYPGAHLVDTFPVLDSLPDFLAPWRNEARAKHKRELELYGRLIMEVRDKIERQMHRPPDCFATRLWESSADLNLDLATIAYVAGSAFEAGTDTTAGTMLWFIMAMLQNPEALKKAQDEIESVVGSDGSLMPGFIHMPDLPYCFALTKEVFRWMPAAPGGFPHYSDHEDYYKGYKFEAKTMVIPNIWAMQHDEEKFPEPLDFKPERFFNNGSIDTNPAALTENHYGFGFGRRSCPGKYLACKTIWIGITRLLWGFDITHECGEDGTPIPVDPNACTSGITSKPYPFPVRIIPRSDRHVDTMKHEWENATRSFA